MDAASSLEERGKAEGRLRAIGDQRYPDGLGIQALGERVRLMLGKPREWWRREVTTIRRSGKCALAFTLRHLDSPLKIGATYLLLVVFFATIFFLCL